MTNEQKRIRNWQKARLVGFGLNDIVMTPYEQELFQQLMRIKFQLLDRWDEQTGFLIGKPLSPYKCCMCNKRVDGKYMIAEEGESGENLYFCNKHHEQYHAEQRQIRSPLRGLVAED